MKNSKFTSYNIECMLRYHYGLHHICFRKASSKRNVSATRKTLELF